MEGCVNHGAFSDTTELCEWIQIGLDTCIPHANFQVNSRSPPWFQQL